MRYVTLRCYGGKFDGRRMNVQDMPRVMIREDARVSLSDEIDYTTEATMPPAYFYRQLRIFKRDTMIDTILIKDGASDAEGLQLWKAVNERNGS